MMETPGDDELRIYIVIRKDIGERVSRPKFGVQCAHATLMLWVDCLRVDPDRAWKYIDGAQPKIILECKDADALLVLHEKSLAAGFPAITVTDIGRTEFDKPTLTAFAVGPLWHEAQAQTSFLKRVRLYHESSAGETANLDSFLDDVDAALALQGDAPETPCPNCGAPNGGNFPHECRPEIAR